MYRRETAKASDEIIASLNIVAYYESRNVVFKSNSGGQAVGLCPFHEDTKPSFSVNTKNGLYICFNASCEANKGGSVFNFEMKHSDVSFFSALKTLAEFANVKLKYNFNPPIESHIAENYHQYLLTNYPILNLFIEKRGITLESIKKFKIGYDLKQKRYTIPVFDEDGNIRNIRYYLLDCPKGLMKFLNYIDYNKETKESRKYGTSRLFNIQDLIKSNTGDTVIISEGELDCIILQQNGFISVTATAGAGNFNKNWVDLFDGKNVIVAFDNDDPGRKGAKRIADFFYESDHIVSIVQWSDSFSEKTDCTDFFVKYSRSKEQFISELLDTAIQYYPQNVEIKKEIEDGKYEEISLYDSNDHKYSGKRVSVKCIVSGKDLTPYIVPSKIKATCDMSRGEACLKCSMLIRGGMDDIFFTAKDPTLINFTNITDKQLRKELTARVFAIECNKLKFETTEFQNIDEIVMIPMVQSFNEDRTSSYTQKLSFCINGEVEANKSYELIGYCHPNPKTQHATMLIDHAVPTQDNIDSFKMTKSLRDSLRIFNPEEDHVESIKERLTDICEDHAYNVHHIYQRHDTQIMYDLAWHSVLTFMFNGERVKKGWIECLAIGDSAQGKSQIAEELLYFYGLGEKITGKNLTLAGLIGGVEKFGDRWILNWGKMPLNDKRLLVFEELTGVPEEILNKMTDVRSSGLADITKIRKEVTNARVRLIMTSNCRNKSKISSYNYGVEAILRLFGTPEDVRRLDVACTVASGELDDIVFNRHRVSSDTVPHKYKSEPSRNLILWAWSRNKNQIKFDAGVEKLILFLASQMSEKYSSKIPLVEAADQRIKIAKLAVALAARLFSCTEDGESILVKGCHVEYIFYYLNRVYDKPSMAYNEYSEYADKGDKISPEDAKVILNRVFELPRYQDLCLSLMGLNRFRKAEVGDIMGYDTDQLKMVFKQLSSMNCIRATSNGFVKQPFFTSMIRDLKNNGKLDYYSNGNSSTNGNANNIELKLDSNYDEKDEEVPF